MHFKYCFANSKGMGLEDCADFFKALSKLKDSYGLLGGFDWIEVNHRLFLTDSELNQ